MGHGGEAVLPNISESLEDGPQRLQGSRSLAAVLPNISEAPRALKTLRSVFKALGDVGKSSVVTPGTVVMRRRGRRWGTAARLLMACGGWRWARGLVRQMVGAPRRCLRTLMAR
jgi:hypothetical protein